MYREKNGIVQKKHYETIISGIFELDAEIVVKHINKFMESHTECKVDVSCDDYEGHRTDIAISGWKDLTQQELLEKQKQEDAKAADTKSRDAMTLAYLKKTYPEWFEST